jgi:phosphohistidine phosphatase SixA
VSVVLLRHASAGDRDHWKGDDRLRPLDKRGWKQSRTLAEELRALGVRRAVSSPYVRCVQTLEPLGLPVEEDERLGEGASREATLELLHALEDAVACTHGDIVENVLGRPLKKGAFVVLQSDCTAI